jgi:hypothetical protein
VLSGVWSGLAEAIKAHWLGRTSGEDQNWEQYKMADFHRWKGFPPAILASLRVLGKD